METRFGMTFPLIIVRRYCLYAAANPTMCTLCYYFGMPPLCYSVQSVALENDKQSLDESSALLI